MKYSAFILAVLIIAGGLAFVGCAASSEARIKAIGEISGQGKLNRSSGDSMYSVRIYYANAADLWSQ